MENNDKKLLKNQLKYIIATNFVIFLTIIVTIYELYNKIEHFYSYILLGLVFIMMSFNQLLHHKRTKSKKYLLMFCIYLILGIAVVGYRVLTAI